MTNKKQNFVDFLILKKDDNLKDYFLINFITLIISTTFACTFIFFRASFENKNVLLFFYFLFISYFLVLFPVLLSGVISFFRKKSLIDSIKFEPFFSLIGLLFLIVISLAAPFFNLLPLVIILGIICIFYYLVIFIKNRLFTVKNIPLIAIIIFFSLFILFTIWSSKYLVYYFSPIFLEKIFVGNTCPDSIFQSTIANMIKNYGIPSTGLHDVIYLPYHYLSHWSFAQFSKLLNINAMQFYQIGFPVIFIPLFFKFFLLVIRSISSKTKSFMNNYLFWLFFIVSFTGFLPKFIYERFFISSTLIVVESYNLSITLALIVFLMIAFFKDYKNHGRKFFNFKNIFFIVLLPVLIFLMGLTKLSTVVIFMAILLYIFIRYAYYKNIVYSISIILAAISAFLSLIITTPKVVSTSSFELFHFFRHIIMGRNEELIWPVTLIFFILIYYFWSISFVTLEALHLKNIDSSGFINNFNKKRTIKIEIVLFLCIIGAMPGIILKIGGGGAQYFSELQKWVSIILLLSLFLSNNLINFDIRKIIKKPVKILAIVLIIILISSIINNFITEFKSFHDDYKHNKKEYNLIIKNDIKDDLVIYRGKLIKALQELDNLSIYEKQNSLIYIPIDNNEFWDLKILPKNYVVPLLVPAISGIGMIYGLPDENSVFTRDFGYGVYKMTSKAAMDKSIEELFFEIKKKGYKNLIILDYGNGDFSVYFVNDSNIENYEGSVYKLFERLYYFSFGINIQFEELYDVIKNLSDNRAILKMIPEIILDDESFFNSKEDEEFIETLYLILLDREVEKTGVQYWLSEFEKGKTREDIIDSILNSLEFKSLTGIKIES